MSGWDIEWGLDGFTQGAGTMITNTANNPYTLSGLTENTDYDVYVRTNCGGTFSDWVGPISIKTELAPIVPNYTTDFATYPADGWSEANGDFMMPTGTSSNFTADDFVNDTAHANGKSAKINIYGSFTDEYMISPIFNLSGVTYYLNFDIALTEFADTTAATLGADDYVSLLVTEDGGTTWTELQKWDSTSTISETGQAVSELTLSGYGTDVKFAFYAFSNTSNEDNDFFIDNFSITTTTLKVESKSLENFALFPTIIKDELSFTSKKEVSEISIYNIMGQKVFSKKPALTNASINVSSLSSGMYIVKVKAGNSLGSYKVIKE